MHVRISFELRPSGSMNVTVRLSVCASGVVTNDKWDAHAEDQGYRAEKMFVPVWALPDYNSILNSEMEMCLVYILSSSIKYQGYKWQKLPILNGFSVSGL